MTPIAIITDNMTFCATLENQCRVVPAIGQAEQAIRAKLGLGETFTASDTVDEDYHIISLHHRDAPIHAAKVLTLPQMDALLAAFCEARDLPFKSADELLAEVAGADHELAAPETINWLSAFVDAYMNHEEYDA